MTLYWRAVTATLLVFAAGLGLGARMAGASLVWGALGVISLFGWLIFINSEPGPNDPPNEQR